MTKNWIYNGREILSLDQFPEEAVGFIYKITNKDNGRFYIGKKNLFSITNPIISKKKYEELKEAGIPVKKQKKKKKDPKKPDEIWNYKQKDLKKETNWLTYTGNSDELNADIKKGSAYVKEILLICDSNRDLTYNEVRTQFVEHVLETCDSYNKNILSKFFKTLECQ